MTHRVGTGRGSKRVNNTSKELQKIGNYRDLWSIWCVPSERDI